MYIPCSHLGSETGNRVLCPTCMGHVEVKLRQCDIYSNCTTHKQVSGYQCCQGCSDYTPLSGYVPPVSSPLMAVTNPTRPLMGSIGTTTVYSGCTPCCSVVSGVASTCYSGAVFQSGVTLPTTLHLTMTGTSGYDGTYAMDWGGSTSIPVWYYSGNSNQGFNFWANMGCRLGSGCFGFMLTLGSPGVGQCIQVCGSSGNTICTAFGGQVWHSCTNSGVPRWEGGINNCPGGGGFMPASGLAVITL